MIRCSYRHLVVRCTLFVVVLGCIDRCETLYRPQFIVGEDGTCGLVYEHSPAEGPPIVFLIDYVVKYM